MISSATHFVVLGICPDNFRADHTFHFIRAVAERYDNKWIRLGDSGSSSKYEPNGDFWAPPDHCQELGPHEIASWEVEDQPDWSSRKRSARFRSLRRVDSPVEIVQARVESTSPTVRDVLTNEGLAFVSRRTDGVALVEFTDGVVVKLRFQAHPSKPGWSIPSQSDLCSPIEAWPSAKSFQVVSFTPNGKQRRFVITDDLAAAPQILDFATLDETIVAATRPGGLGSYSGPSSYELKKSREKLQEVLKSFPPGKWEARRKRLEQFLADSQLAEAAKESLVTYLSGHAAFQKAVESRATEKANELRETLRAEVWASEVEVVQRIQAKEQEYSDVAEMVRQEAEQRDSVSGEVETLLREKHSLEAEISTLRQVCDTPYVTMVQAPRAGAQWLSATSETSVSSTDALITLIEKNLVAIGITALMARQIGFEVVAAASLGQITFFRGSLARPVAEAVGLSLAGESLRTVQVTLGISDTLPIDLEPSNPSQAVLILGANLACLETYANEIKRTVFQRRLFSQFQRLPILLATLENGPSSLPLEPNILDLGPVLDTDVLRWRLPTKEPVLCRGKFDATLLHVLDGETDIELWKRVVESTGTATGLWSGLADSVLKRLSGLAPSAKGSQPGMSFLFGWHLPRLLAKVSTLSEYKESIQIALTASAEPDPRVVAILRANKVEENE